MTKQERRNKYFFGLGTVGRDMFYALEANTLIYYLSNVLSLPAGVFLAASMVLTVLRILDAVNDPITGLIIDNIRSPWGKYKPPMLIGALTSCAFFMIMFTDFGLKDYWFVVVFGLAYVLWDITYGINDIAYWSMLPSLSLDQKKRENFGAFARICANVGMFGIMVAWEPVTSSLGNTTKVWFYVALAVSVAMIGFQLFTILGVKEEPERFKKEESTSIKEMFSVLFKNDQLMWTTLAMMLFNLGYFTTTGIAIYYMEYVFGDKGMYAVLAAICGVAQLASLMVFPLISKRVNRKQFYGISTVIILIGYAVFFFADHSIVLVALAAVLMFVGEGFIQLLMLMFLSDTIEYGQWKLGKRNDSVTFSIQPFLNKIGGALSTAMISVSIVLAGIKTGDTAAVSIDDSGKLVIKIAMLVVPLIAIVAGYLVYRAKYKIDEERYAQIVTELKERGDIVDP